MKQLRLKNISENHFHKAWKLYEDAFPSEERRLLDAQIHIMKNPNYHFDILIDKKQLIGFLLWWDFESLRYIDHFATNTLIRNKGFGKLILEKFMSINNKPILLEVELPNSTINQRRIKFYERIGFKLNLHHYELPIFNKDEPPLQLFLMSYPVHISKKDVEQFIKICHPVVFKD